MQIIEANKNKQARIRSQIPRYLLWNEVDV